MVTEEDFAELSLHFQRNSLCGIRMVWLLSLPLALFVFALAGYAGAVNFKVGLHSVLMIGAIFLIWLFFAPHNAYFASCKLRRDFAGIKQSLAAFINKHTLGIGGIEKADAPLDDFMADAATAMRNEHFSSVAAGIFPTLGILGTFISIAISMPEFSAQTSEVLEQEISRLLGGVGTAFYVSIYGIFLSIWWIFFEKNGISRFERDVAFVKETTRPFFWGKEEIEQTYFRKSMAHFEKLETVFDTMASHDFIDSLNKTLGQRMHIFEQIIEREQKAAEELGRFVAQSSLALQGMLQQYVSVSDALRGTGEELGRFMQQMERLGTRMEQLQLLLSEEYKNGTALTEKLGGEVARLNETLSLVSAENVHELYSGVLANIATMKAEIDRIGVQFNERMNGFDEQFLEKLKHTLQLIDSETARIVEQLARLEGSGMETR